MSPLAAAVKKVVSIPVITVGRLDAVIGEKILEEGRADFIGICKGLMGGSGDRQQGCGRQIGGYRSMLGCGDCSRSLFLNIIRGEFVPIQCRINAALGSDQIMKSSLLRRRKKWWSLAAARGDGGGPCRGDQRA